MAKKRLEMKRRKSFVVGLTFKEANEINKEKIEDEKNDKTPLKPNDRLHDDQDEQKVFVVSDYSAGDTPRADDRLFVTPFWRLTSDQKI